MNASNPQNLPAERKAPPPQVRAGGNVAALIPQSIDEAFRVANALALSGLAPRGMDRPEQVMAVIMAGSEIGFAPYQSVQSFAMVNNRPSLWGDAIPALLWSKGFELDEWFDDDDRPTKAFCKVTRPSGKTIERTYSLNDAKLAGLINKAGTWQTGQKRMLQMRARAFAARDGASDALKGLPIYEEVQDYQHNVEGGRRAPGAGTGMRARLEERAAALEPNGGFDPDHIEGELREEVVDADFTDEAIDQRTDEERAAADRLAPETETWDTVAYAQGQRDNADRIADEAGEPASEREATLRAWWDQLGADDDFKRLTAEDEAEALLVKAHVVKRLKALKGGAE